MQPNDPIQHQDNLPSQQVDIHSYPIPIRIKHPSWAVRKGTYQQILYYIKSITNLNDQILISGTVYTIDTLLPQFQMLVHEKHASVLLKGLQCVQQILKVDKRLSGKHCIKTLIDKGIEYFPLMSQQRKGILEKFLDVLELSRVDAGFLKNKLNLLHQKSVMYVIQVIGVLNVTQLKSVLINLSKKHQKKCVRELAAEIAQQLQPPNNQPSPNQQQPSHTQKPQPSKISKSATTSKSNLLPPSTCKLTIQKLPHYEQLPSKKQQQYSHELAQKIPLIIEQYSQSQVPSFSHVLRLMIDDNNHIVNVNAIKVMIQIFESQGNTGVQSTGNSNKSLIPQSFPLLFIFNKFKSHKTHPINSLLLSLAESILKSTTTNRLTDLLLAINEGLACTGSKANVKFGCSVTFFRILSLIYSSEDLYVCTTNENLQNENQDLQQKFSYFERVKLTKNQLKLVQKIISVLQKDKKYDTEMYLIRYATGVQEQIQLGVEGNRDKDKGMRQNNSSSSQLIVAKQKRLQPSIQPINNNKSVITKSKPSKPTQKAQTPPPQTTKTPFTQPKTTTNNKFTEINLQSTLRQIIRTLNTQPHSFKQLKSLLQKSTQQFYTCVRERRYEMFYLCELLQSFIQNYIVKEQTIEHVSQYLTNLLRIISLLKPMIVLTPQSSVKYKQIAVANVSQLLLVGLCKLAIGEEIQEVVQNLNTNYGYEIILQSLQALLSTTQNHPVNNKIKKKNKKHLIQWLQSSTPSMFLNSDFYKLIDRINYSKKEKKEKCDNQNMNTFTQNTAVTQSSSPKQQPKLKQTPTKNSKLAPLAQEQYQPLQSSRKKHLDSQLQDINLSNIQNNPIESNYYDEDDDIQKSSFHQNIEQQLKQISTERSYCYYKDKGRQQQHQQQQDVNMSRQYLRGLNVDKFKKKDIVTDSQCDNALLAKGDDVIISSNFTQAVANNNNSQSQQQQPVQNYYDEQQHYMTKFNQVEQRRLQRQRQRREFMDRMKCEYKPVMATQEQAGEEVERISEEEEGGHDNGGCDDSRLQKHESPLRRSEGNGNVTTQHAANLLSLQQYQQQQKLPLLNLVQSPSFATQQQQSQSPPNNKPTNNSDDSSFLSTNSTGEFKYRFINHEKLAYMLKSTTNPYPHLRTLILIPFKSSPKKHSFLQQLFHFYTHHVEFKSPQPYTGLVLLTILMFSQIKQDKTLIQPLQSLYQLVAKQSTTNEFLKTIITLFHTVIQQTLLINRKFLITILLKSMVRMLPFIEDGLSLLRDIQQFYQIGEMVYFEMFEEEYKQIRGCLEDEGVHAIVEKALQEEGDNLKAIVEGWLATGWKGKVVQAIDELHQYQEQQQQQHDDYNNHQQQQYQPYI